MKIKKQFMRIIARHTSLLLIALFVLVTAAITKQELAGVYKQESGMGHTVADMLNGDKLYEYAHTLEADDEYYLMEEKLKQVKENFSDCTSLYIFVPDDDGGAIYVYDIYTDEEYATKELDVGELGFVEDFNEDVLGSAIKLYETGGETKKLDIDFFTKYGSFASYYVPVYNDEGVIRAIIGIDYSIIDIVEFIGMIMGIMLVLFVLSGALLGAYELNDIENRIIRPISVISEKVDEYVKSEHNGNSQQYRIEVVENSENEIDMLGADMNQMMQDMDEFIITMERETRENTRIASELDLASKIQASYLPNTFPAFPERKDFDIYATMDPAKEVGGDFYDYFLIDENHLGLVIADVSGKGVGASLFMMISKTMLNDQALFIKSPASILEQVNNRLCANNEQEMFVTVWLGVLNLETGLLKAANAGHEFPVIKRAAGNFEFIKDKHGFVLAGMEGVKYSEYEIQLETGDKLYVYTDGVAEATNAQNELFGTDRILEALNKSKDESIKDILLNMRTEIDAFVQEAPQFDDITMLGVQYNGRQ